MTSIAITDPLFSGGVDTTVVLIIIGKTIAVFVLVLLSVLLYIWFLRKVIARMQNRIGPDRAGPFGLLQTLADGIKLFFKEQSVPTTADRKIFFLAPYLSLTSGVPCVRHRADRRRRDHRRAPDVPPARRPPGRRPVAHRHVGAGSLRRAPRGLVVGFEVPAARLGARVGAAAQLRGGVLARNRGRARAGEHALHPRHRRRSRAGTGSSRSSTATGTGYRRSSHWSCS